MAKKTAARNAPVKSVATRAPSKGSGGSAKASKPSARANSGKAGKSAAKTGATRAAPANDKPSPSTQPKANTKTMPTRKPTSASNPPAKGAKSGVAPKGASGKTGASAKSGADARAGARKDTRAGAAPSGGTPAKGKGATASASAAKGAGSMAKGARPAGKGARPSRGAGDEARTPASLARAAMQSAEKAREAAKPKKSPYSKSQLVPMRKALLETRTRIIGDINQMEKEALRADDADVDAENVADHGTDAFERNMTLGLMESEARTLRKIGEALEAIEAGRYGLCSACGESIPLARLEALPFAGTCVPCQEAQERRM